MSPSKTSKLYKKISEIDPFLRNHGLGQNVQAVFKVVDYSYGTTYNSIENYIDFLHNQGFLFSCNFSISLIINGQLYGIINISSIDKRSGVAVVTKLIRLQGNHLPLVTFEFFILELLEAMDMNTLIWNTSGNLAFKIEPTIRTVSCNIKVI